jgi:hypothetical protein
MMGGRSVFIRLSCILTTELGSDLEGDDIACVFVRLVEEDLDLLTSKGRV